jgi:type 1 glutamine amidotransferase
MAVNRVVALALVIFAQVLASQWGRAAEPAHKTIVLVYTQPDHPWASHMYEQECKLLAHCLKQTPGVDSTVAKDWPEKSQLDHASSLVFYSRPAGDLALSPEHRNQFLQSMKEGVGFAAIHWATGAEVERGQEYSNVSGGWFNFAHAGLKVDSQQLVQVNPDHPICRGWKPYQLHDEFYLNMKFHEQAKPLLKVNIDGKDQVVAWTMERPDSHEGRSFATTLGHFHENFTVPSFRRAIVNGILWTAHVEVPDQGAPVEADEKELKLPPQS